MSFAGYVRVSRVNSREGESFISPDVQRKSIERWAKANGVKLVEVVEELDVSGAKSAEVRQLGKLIERCESGELEGIIVWKLSRFGRKLSDILTNVERLTNANARLVAVEDGIDSGAKGSKLVLGIFGLLAEIERDSRTEGWSTAVESAIARGVHVGVAPFGYTRDETGHLHPDPVTAPVVRAAFLQRGYRRSWADIARFIEDETGRSINHSVLSKMLASRTYLGEVYSGKFVKQNAHEALVDENVWQAAQWKGTTKRNGTIAGAGILAGLITCSGCGKVLARSQSAGKPIYACRTNRTGAGGVCEAPSSALVSDVDELVAPGIIQRLGRAKNRSHELAEASERFSAANQELDAFLEHASVALLGEKYPAEVEKRREAIRVALDHLNQLNQELAQGFPRPEDWNELPIERKREVAHSLIESVSLSKSTRGRWQPISERATVVWK